MLQKMRLGVDDNYVDVIFHDDDETVTLRVGADGRWSAIELTHAGCLIVAQALVGTED